MADTDRMRSEFDPVRINQTEFGELGNCQSACLAMLLAVTLDEVPNFTAMDCSDVQKFIEQDRWLHARGWAIVTLGQWESRHVAGWYIAGGPSPRGIEHSVVYHAGVQWHDPHPDHTGLLKVTTIDLLYPLTPFALWQAACRAQAKRDAEICRVRAILNAGTPSTPLKQERYAEDIACANAVEQEAGL